ncbi:MAG: hypothetical protein HN368_07940 [Spirochaetales bacterium]|jgi:hypothetical protein|nr:hypothetical protein [Spirochaetales bacterium]
MSKRDSLLLAAGIACTAFSVYQLMALGLASFYTLFSIGMTLILTCLSNSLSKKRLFNSWPILHLSVFCLLLLAVSVGIDHIGMRVGYWEYPHYDSSDQFRKYLFEWGVALFYHFAALLVGRELFRKAGFSNKWSFVLSLLIVVTIAGFITESLNLVVYSWRITRMPVTNYRIGKYFLVFQTIGYWLMALIPFGIYRFVEYLVEKSRVENRESSASPW